MRLVLHAGFGKCGSSSLQSALNRKQAELRARSVFLFDDQLSIDRETKVAVIPSSTFSGGRLTARIAGALNSLAASAPNGTAVLSSIALSESVNVAPLFHGIDESFDTTIVFYVRPQFEWIPSAWKQWGMKDGTPMSAFVDQRLDINDPPFGQIIEGWAEALPNARVVVRVLAQAIADNGDPGSDLFKILGLDTLGANVAPSNPSFDFSILHVLSKNPELFKHSDDNSVFFGLTKVLPKAYLSTNLAMLPFAEQDRIARHFHDENVRILEKYGQTNRLGPKAVYDTYFQPRPADRAYGDASDLDIIYRCLGIILETLPTLKAMQGKAIFRPPYWKIPRRIARRLAGRY